MNDIGVLHTYLWLDIGYTCEIMRHEEHISFIVFRIVRRSSDGEPLYQITAENFDQLTTNPDMALHVLEGVMNWDGCLDFACDHERVHFCHKQDTKDFGRMMIRLHKKTYKIMSEEEP